MAWHQFSIVQFPSHQFVWKVPSVQSGARKPSASVPFVQFSSRTLPVSTRIDLAGSIRPRLGSVHRVFSCLGGAVVCRSPPAKILALRPGVCRLEGGGGWCALLVVLACLPGMRVPPFSSFSSVQFIQFSSQTLPAVTGTNGQVIHAELVSTHASLPSPVLKKLQ